MTTVTSKLDNKWKEPPKKAVLPSARTISMVINQSGPNARGGNAHPRPSIAWATPGTVKSVAEELGEEVDALEESILESEDEDMDEEDQATPMTTVKRGGGGAEQCQSVQVSVWWDDDFLCWVVGWTR